MSAAWLVYGALAAWRAGSEARAQGWSALGLDALTREAWASQRPWREASLVALVALAITLVGEAAIREAKAWRWIRGANRGLGSIPVCAGLALLALGAPSAVARWAAPRPAADSPNVLIVLVDTWRADHAGFLGYPRPVSPQLDALTAQGVVFERARAHTGWTKPSVATLLTGVLPSRHRALSQPVLALAVRGTQLPPDATTLIEILRGHGWDTGMWSNNPNILPERGFGQGAAHFADYFHAPGRAAGVDPGTIDKVLPDVRRWLATERDPERPFCAYVHVMDPHYPYAAPPPFGGTFDASGDEAELVGPIVDEYLALERAPDRVSPERRAHFVDSYDEELLFVDAHLGPFLAEVRQRHPNTVIVLAGDHGEEFLEHGQFGHGQSIYEELVRVPLVVWAPGLAPRRVATQVRLMDVVPTLLELAHLELPAPHLQGRTLLPVIDGTESADRLVPFESGGDERPPWQWRGISDGRWKLVRREKDLPTSRPVPLLTNFDSTEERPYWRLFDLETDPGETKNLIDEQRARAEQLFAALQEHGWFMAPEQLLRLRAARTHMTAVDQRELEKLGYAQSKRDR
jgi:arylsulfatase A-like enzyme